MRMKSNIILRMSGAFSSLSKSIPLKVRRVGHRPRECKALLGNGCRLIYPETAFRTFRFSLSVRLAPPHSTFPLCIYIPLFPSSHDLFSSNSPFAWILLPYTAANWASLNRQDLWSYYLTMTPLTTFTLFPTSLPKFATRSGLSPSLLHE
jgi:hypothetical protein